MQGKRVCTILIASTAALLLFSSAALPKTADVFCRDRRLPTLVIDAGHGGFDGGAVGANGTSEQHINLSVARSTQALSSLFGYLSAMTRPDEQALDYIAGRSVHENKVADIKARERITNEITDPIFLSIHLNKFEDPKYYGAQVFYSKNHVDSQILAEKTQKSLISGIRNGNIRRAKPAAPAIYLMKKLDCPAVIVECGFLSNPDEERRLCDPGYQKRLALCIFAGYQEYLHPSETE